MDERLVASLRVCGTRAMVEDTFDMFKASELEERYNALLEAMYNPDVFFSSSHPDLNVRYELVMNMFLIKKWKSLDTQDIRGKQIMDEFAMDDGKLEYIAHAFELTLLSVKQWYVEYSKMNDDLKSISRTRPSSLSRHIQRYLSACELRTH